MEEPIKVLYFVDRMLRGGIQSLVVDWVSRFDKNKIHVDFLLLDDGIHYELEDTLKELGCNVYKMNGIWIRKPFDFLKEAKALDYFFKHHHDYSAVHMHSSSKNYMVLKYARKYNIPIRISHAHASDFQADSYIKKLVGNILKPQLIKYSTNYLACSTEAGIWLYGKKIYKAGKIKVIHNGVDYEKFKYCQANRENIRKNYNIKNDDVLIGHVGRFTKVKNHIFMIDVINKLVKKNSKFKIMFIGEGILEEKIKETVKKLDISNNIIFAGYQPNVAEYLSAFDLFILPSVYEGLGLALIEAQANGLTCIATKDNIPNDVKISKNFKFLELDSDKWADAILCANLKRSNNFENLKEKGYVVDDSIETLTNIYFNIG